MLMYQRQLSPHETDTLASLLLGTDDDLEIGIRQIADPETIVDAARSLRQLAKVVQCEDCGEWVKRRKHKCSVGSNGS